MKRPSTIKIISWLYSTNWFLGGPIVWAASRWYVERQQARRAQRRRAGTL